MHPAGVSGGVPTFIINQRRLSINNRPKRAPLVLFAALHPFRKYEPAHECINIQRRGFSLVAENKQSQRG